MSDHNNKMSAAEIGLANIGRGGAEGLPADHIGIAGQVVRGALTGSQRDRVQREIAATMAGLISDCRRGPNGFDPTNRPASPTVQVGGAVPARGGPGNGWAKEIPIGPPGGATAQTVIEAMCHQALPHQRGNAAFRGPPKKAEE